MAHAQEFALVPTEEQLREIERELRFEPAKNPSPKVLSREQIDFYNANGYLMPLTAFDADEAADFRNWFDGLLDKTLGAGKDSYSISSAHLKYGRIWDLLRNERIVGPVADLLGENVVGWGAHFFCKMPGDGKQVTWHQDASYWPMTPSRTVTVWLAVDDADVENAAMRFLPGSHLEGRIPYRESAGGEGNVLTQTVEGIERFGEPVDDILRAGQFSLHSDLLLHGSEANRSTRRRCGLTLRYCAVEVRAHLGWNAKGLIVRGRDSEGYWSDPPRPAND
jgi:ectoine hydroxylase-related dioxygenase (phytanoyl-CoA dioxygenase family)